MLSKVSLLGVLTFLVAGLATAQNGDAAQGQQRYATCQACHGADGAGVPNLGGPRLAGQEGWYLKRQIENFKTGLRGADPKDILGAQMKAMAATLADEQAVKDVVAYIETLDGAAPDRTEQTGDPTKGKALYTVCMACHGSDGKGNPSLSAPGLTGQHDTYLIRQIQNFKNGIRGSNAKDIYGLQMKSMVATLADEQAVKDVVAYIMTLGGEN